MTKQIHSLEPLGQLQLAVLNLVSQLSNGVYMGEQDACELDTIIREFHDSIARQPRLGDTGEYVAFTQKSEDERSLTFGVTHSDPEIDESYDIVTLPVKLLEEWVYPVFKLEPWVRAVLSLYPGFDENKLSRDDLLNGFDAARKEFITVLVEKSGCSETLLTQCHFVDGWSGLTSVCINYPKNVSVKVTRQQLMFWYHARHRPDNRLESM